MTPLVRCTSVAKSFEGGRLQALRGLDLAVGSGEAVAITGPSGCGKSTLLSILGGLDRPTSGTVLVDGAAIGAREPLHLYRARTANFVFQLHNLLFGMTILDNVAAPLVGAGAMSGRDRRARALVMLEAVGLASRANARPPALSGGERQRAAVARALVASPRLVLADEPTGNLDSAAGAVVAELLFAQVRAHGATLILATHDPALAARCDRVLTMRDGVFAGV
ncbi:MAG: ABC transporter ATP-binding protein [Labilithrix sp.]